MEKLESLKLTNAKEIDTSMAKEYINKINEDDQWPEDDLFYTDVKPGKIIKTEEIFYALRDVNGATGTHLGNDLKTQGDIIAEKIEENAEMFVQLEYLLRGTDPRDVREGHIKLMAQLAQCNNSLWNDFFICPKMIFTESSPLYNLAFVFWALRSDPQSLKSNNNMPMIMINNRKLKPLCKFFVNLCRDAKLDVALVYTIRANMEDHLKEVLPCGEPADNMGCTGVVAERADLDSAIDCFINSSASAPWRFKQIYVQESIFEDFVDALRAKGRGVTGAGAVRVGDKTFLLEGEGGEGGRGGEGGQGGRGLPTSAFRSAREVLDLIDTPYLSLWAAETALSHEIALRSPSSTIWINDYASFYGPPRSALSVFKMQSTFSSECPDIKEILSKWSELRTEERFNVINAAITASNDEILKQCLPGLREYRADALLEVTNNTICFGIQKHLGLIRYYETVADKSSCLIVLKVLLNGNGICWRGFNSMKILKELQNFGIPITAYYYSLKGDVIRIPCPMLLERLKVIRTNYGTIFAN